MMPDVEERVAADFDGPDRVEAMTILGLLEQELENVERPRVLRCVVFLAGGDLGRLVHFADRALQDWPDVIYWAEYDKQDRRLRDLSGPSCSS